MKKSIKRNYIYNMIYQVFIMITPLITTPYVSRVLKSSGVGQYSFTKSISSYFILFGSLGFGYYAQRQIAREQDNKYKQSKTFWEIFLCRLISVSISLFVYYTLIMFGFFGEYRTIMIIFSINIIAVIFDITFLFQGNEMFGPIVFRNIIIKCIGMIMIFVFVKESTDIWIFAVCNSLMCIVSNLALWWKIKNLIVKIKFKDLKISRHFIPTLKLFIPTIAASIYTVLDKTLIGVMVQGTISTTNNNGEVIITKISDLENGYYEQAQKLVRTSLSLVTALGIVMIPRNSQDIASGNHVTFKKNIYKAIQFVFFLGIPIMFGMASIALNICPWFFGPGFEKVPYLIMIFSPITLSIGLSSVFGLQYLIPLGEDAKFSKAIISGAIINFIMNIILIHFINSYGAAIGSVIAETSVSLIMFLMIRKEISAKKIISDSWKYVIAGIMMFFLVFFTQRYLYPSIINSILLALEGIISYVSILIILKDIFLKELLNLLLIKVKRNNN